MMYDRSKCEVVVMEEEFSNKHVTGIAPVYSTLTAAAADVAIPEEVIVPAHGSTYVDLFLRTNIENGYCILMFPRSSLLIRHELFMPVSVIDSDYKCNIHAPLYNPTNHDITLEKGTRIAQIMLQDCSIKVTNNFKNAQRIGGCGSTGV